VGADVIEDSAGQKLMFSFGRGVGWVDLVAGPVSKLFSNLVSNLRCAYLHMESGEQVKCSVVARGIMENESPDLDIEVGNIRTRSGFDLQTGRESVPEPGNPLFRFLARPRGDNQGRYEGNLRRPMPFAKPKKRVGAHETEQDATGRKFGAQRPEGIHGEVGFSRELWPIDKRNRETRLGGDGQPGHGHAVLEGGNRPLGFKRLCADRSEDDCVQRKSRAGGAGNSQVAQVRWVKTSAEEGDAFSGDEWLALLHVLIVTCSAAGRRGSGSISLTEMRFLIILLALAGVVVSALALRVHYDTGTEPCSINEKWDCGIVNHSPFAEVAHIPVAAIGIAGYLTLAGLALARRRAWLAGLALIGLGFALYLSNIERSVLEVWCLYCVISQGIIALVTLLSLGWLGAAQWSKRRTQS
jgi:uncharacterized membrane protein